MMNFEERVAVLSRIVDILMVSFFYLFLFIDHIVTMCVEFPERMDNFFLLQHVGVSRTKQL